MFSNLVLLYILFAFIFQFFALAFVISDSRCKGNKLVWLIAVLLTGPVAIGIYLFKGRQEAE